MKFVEPLTDGVDSHLGIGNLQVDGITYPMMGISIPNKEDIPEFVMSIGVSVEDNVLSCGKKYPPPFHDKITVRGKTNAFSIKIEKDKDSISIRMDSKKRFLGMPIFSSYGNLPLTDKNKALFKEFMSLFEKYGYFVFILTHKDKPINKFMLFMRELDVVEHNEAGS